jgi:hypothetical protein
MKITPSAAFFLLLLTSNVFGATYISTNTVSSSISLSGDLLDGLLPSGTATREGGDTDTNVIGLGSLTDGVTGSTSSGRSFVNSGTLDYDLGGAFNISTIYFRLVNAVVDDRLAFNTTVEFSYNNGGNYSLITTVLDPFDNTGGQFATTGELNSIGGLAVTNIRFNLANVGTYSASFSEIDVVGTAVPEPSLSMLLLSTVCFSTTLRRRNRKNG